MNEHKGLRLWKWAVILLVMCNIALIVTIWVRPSLPYGQRPEQPRDYVIRNLKFTDSEVKQYDALIAVHKVAMATLRKEGKEYRQQLFGNIKNNGQGGFRPDSLINLIATNQKQIEQVTYDHFVQVRAICTDAQKATFDNIIGDIMKRMNGNGRGPHHPGDRPGPPEGREGENGPPPGPPEDN